MSTESTPTFDPEREVLVALRLTLLALVTLTVVKPLAGIPIIGQAGLLLAAAMQLMLPLWRADRLGLDDRFVGLHLRTWRQDLRGVVWLMLLTFPPYALGHAWAMQHGAQVLANMGLHDLAAITPTGVFEPNYAFRVGWGDWVMRTGQSVAVHTVGVALPEETFYRGYLQARLEHRWPPKGRIFGVALGRAAVVASLFFAIGHVLGEWNPLRLGPFFPGLLFAWLRNRSGSVVGAIAFHALCNVFGEILFSLYRPG